MQKKGINLTNVYIFRIAFRNYENKSKNNPSKKLQYKTKKNVKQK